MDEAAIGALICGDRCQTVNKEKQFCVMGPHPPDGWKLLTRQQCLLLSCTIGTELGILGNCGLLNVVRRRVEDVLTLGSQQKVQPHLEGYCTFI